jgi:hypothetical protein
VATWLRKIAVIYEAQDRYEEALEMHTKSLENKARIYGGIRKKMPSTLQSITSLSLSLSLPLSLSLSRARALSLSHTHSPRKEIPSTLQ